MYKTKTLLLPLIIMFVLTFSVSSWAQTVTGGVQVELAVQQDWIGDLVFKLQSPTGTITTLMSRPGLAEPDDGITGVCCGSSFDLLSAFPITIRNGGVTDAEAMGSGGNPCSGDGLCDYFPNPGMGPGTDLSDFDTETALGNWTFCVGDGAGANEGTFDSWTLTVNTDAGPQIMTASPAITITDNAYDGTLGSMACDTINLAPSVPVPTISEYGMILLSMLLAVFAVIALRRKKIAA